MDSAELPLVDDTAAAPPQLTPWAGSIARAGFMGRRGGISRGIYASFNLAHWVGDNPDAVAANWRRWHARNPALRPAMLSQVHRAEVLRVRNGDPILDGHRPPADGLITTDSGIALSIFSADCVPVLLFDAATHAAAAMHSGWRGTLANIVGVGLEAMTDLGARFDHIQAAIGPAIGQCCFEVDAALADEFTCRMPATLDFRQPGRPGKAYLDLRGIVRWQLEAAGLDPDAIQLLGPCTRCHTTEYFSRRASGGAMTGLQMSFIGFNE
jgi:polyphenol oxidase